MSGARASTDDAPNAVVEKACPLLKFIPAVPPQANKHREQVLTFERDAFVAAVDGMWKHPDLKRDVGDFVKTAIAEKMKLQQTATTADSPVTATCLNDYDEDVCAAYLSKVLRLELSVLGKARTKEPKIVKILMGGLLLMTHVWSSWLRRPPSISRPASSLQPPSLR